MAVDLMLVALGGALVGAVGGHLCAWFQWWMKDLRDMRLLHHGQRVPRDRVFPHMEVFTGLVGGAMAGSVWLLLSWPMPVAVLSPLAMPSISLLMLLGAAFWTLVDGVAPARR